MYGVGRGREVNDVKVREWGEGSGERGDREWGGLRVPTTSSRNPRLELISKCPYSHSRFPFFVCASPAGDIGGWFSITGVDPVLVWDDTPCSACGKGRERKRGGEGGRGRGREGGRKGNGKGKGNRDGWKDGRRKEKGKERKGKWKGRERKGKGMRKGSRTEGRGEDEGERGTDIREKGKAKGWEEG